ncbi:2-oxoglutarate and iron-dependent oxygenase domain-containing protein CP2 isoform X2 [Cryptomeria japonica]|uniref:2-oxoglutarate and iron-dependent oxygenase domain-containing protein CP2 isoform X2 n=1 Tax=Cryptomeria japonica TaxID=3369 RepID=UPI0025AC1BEB|nr:2-oxoglutarate and iron-dependent oxygenase domain-containing protein CP2 isoform X2 [Cryptomeria japonica]
MSPDSRHGRKKASISESNGTSREILGLRELCEGEVGGNSSTIRLWRDPNLDHRPDSYEDYKSDYHPALFSALERHLPGHILDATKDAKLHVLGKVVSRYAPRGERKRAQRHKEYRERIFNEYQPLHKDLRTMNPLDYCVQTFIDAVKENTQESFRRIVMEPLPGVYAFDLLQKEFCQLLLDEVENFEKWVDATNFDVMRPNTMNKYGVVLDDFGFDNMLDKLMIDFIKPLASVLFPDVGGSTLDTHHGFVVEYSKERDLDLGFHVDDSEVTLNVFLGKQFTGGELFFRGVRCDKHVNDEIDTEEIFEYSHNPGYAVLHAGRHRHGVKEIASGHKTNLILWCRRELRKHHRDFPSWCGECLRQKKERRKQLMEEKQQNQDSQPYSCKSMGVQYRSIVYILNEASLQQHFFSPGRLHDRFPFFPSLTKVVNYHRVNGMMS